MIKSIYYFTFLYFIIYLLNLEHNDMKSPLLSSRCDSPSLLPKFPRHYLTSNQTLMQLCASDLYRYSSQSLSNLIKACKVFCFHAIARIGALLSLSQ